MTKNIIIIISIGVVIFLSSLFVLASFDNEDAEENTKTATTNTSQINTTSRYAPQSSEEASVKVDVIPKQLGVDFQKNIFEVNLNTHSVDLSYDFINVITLKDDLGNVYESLEWTGNSGWHHVSGDIIFPQINKSAQNIILEIKNINGIDHQFSWQI